MVDSILQHFPDAIVSSGYARIRCPYHKAGKEKRPSMGILLEGKGTMEAGTCHCFTCGKVIAFSDMVKELGFTPPDLAESKPKTNFRLDLITSQVLYKPQLPFRFSPYLLSRGISKETQERFKVYEARGLVNMPVFDSEGKYLYNNARSVISKRYFVQSGIEKSIYGTEEVNISYPIFVVEGQIDAMSLWEGGFQAIATLGADNTRQLKEYLDSVPSKVILAFDNDDAGNRATEIIYTHLGGFRCQRLHLPKGKDVNDLLCESASVSKFRERIMSLLGSVR